MDRIGRWGGSLADGKKETGAFAVEKTFFSTEGKYVEAFTTQGVFPPTKEQIDTIGYHLVGDESLMKELAYAKYKQVLDHLLPTEEDRKTSHGLFLIK